MTTEERTFVEAFRAGTLPEGGFRHRDHIRMAWLYVREYGLPGAVTRFTDDLKAFAAAKGVPGLFHATITWAYLAIVAERLGTTPDGTWSAFAAAHADLFRWKPSVLDVYYSPARLWSDAARATFLMPDRAPHVGPSRATTR